MFLQLYLLSLTKEINKIIFIQKFIKYFWYEIKINLKKTKIRNNIIIISNKICQHVIKMYMMYYWN